MLIPLILSHGIFDLNIECQLLALHSKHHARDGPEGVRGDLLGDGIEDANIEPCCGLVFVGLGADVPGVFHLCILDDQLPLCALLDKT